MSNIAPHSIAKFDPSRHILSQDVIFADPGIHLILKWTKTLQERSAHHIVQLPHLKNKWLCPVTVVRDLLLSRPLPHNAPLFALLSPPHPQVIETPIRYALKSILKAINYPLAGHGFHSFRRFGATLTYDNNIPLQNSLMAFGGVLQFVTIYSKHLVPLPSFPSHLLPSSLLLCSWVWDLKCLSKHFKFLPLNLYIILTNSGIN